MHIHIYIHGCIFLEYIIINIGIQIYIFWKYITYLLCIIYKIEKGTSTVYTSLPASGSDRSASRLGHAGQHQSAAHAAGTPRRLRVTSAWTPWTPSSSSSLWNRTSRIFSGKRWPAVRRSPHYSSLTCWAIAQLPDSSIPSTVSAPLAVVRTWAGSPEIFRTNRLSPLSLPTSALV
jgi:hypothetical protein